MKETIALKRVEIYEPWRLAADAVSVVRAHRRGLRADAPPDLLRRLADSLTPIASQLPDEARTAVHDFIPLARVREIPLDDMLQSLWVIAQSFGRAVTGADGVDRRFVRDRPSLASEKKLLTAAFGMDESLGMGGCIPAVELSERATVGLAVARRILCHWLDDGLIYIPADVLEPDTNEGFMLNEAAEDRLHNWHEYEQEQLAMRNVTVDLPFSNQLPHDYKDLARGAGVPYGIACHAVVPTKAGLAVSFVVPEDWNADDPRLAQYAQDIVHMLANPRVQAAVHAPVNATFHANQVGAQGITAIASDNTLVQHNTHTWNQAEVTHMSADLATLRKALLAEADNDDDALEDARTVATAQKSLASGDHSGFAGAMRRLKAKGWQMAQKLALAYVDHKLRDKLGLPPE